MSGFAGWKWTTLMVLALLLGAVPLGLSLGGATASASPPGVVHNFTGTGIANDPTGIVTGPDGNLWFTNLMSNSIGRITPTGTSTSFTGTGIDGPAAIIVGPDNALWFVNADNYSLGRITTAGVVTNFALTNDPDVCNSPEGIAVGPDGNLWVGCHYAIARVTTAGVVTIFTDANLGQAWGMAAGPDGNVWFANTGPNSIGKITPSGVVTTFTDPRLGQPSGVVSGPDGNLWFTDFNNLIGRVTTTGTISVFSDVSLSSPTSITSGPDGNLWFTNSGHPGSIGRITTAGVISSYSDPTIQEPAGITTGPDHNMWFTNSGFPGSIGQITNFVPSTDPTGDFTPLTPARILDTRDGTGNHNGPLGPGSSMDVQITGQGGVPASGVAAVVLNATVTQPSASSFLTIWPTGEPRPTISNLNYAAGQTVPNAVTMEVGSGGKVSVFNLAGSTQVIFDVVGYYANDAGPLGSRFHGLTPVRAFDTRAGTGGVPTAPVGQNATLKFTVSGQGGVPASGVTAVVLNVTVTNPSLPSYLTIYPDDVPRPSASSLNFPAGQTVPNLVVVRVPASGSIDFYNFLGHTDVLADVVGYYDQDTYSDTGRMIPLAPQRLLDTRALGESLGPDSGGTLQVTGTGGVPASGVGSVILNVTVTDTTSPGFLTVFPDDDCSLPLASNLNFVAGQTVPNLVMVRVSTATGCAANAGAVDFYNASGTTDVIVDVFGYFT